MYIEIISAFIIENNISFKNIDILCKSIEKATNFKDLTTKILQRTDIILVFCIRNNSGTSRFSLRTTKEKKDFATTLLSQRTLQNSY